MDGSGGDKRSSGPAPAGAPAGGDGATHSADHTPADGSSAGGKVEESARAGSSEPTTPAKVYMLLDNLAAQEIPAAKVPFLHEVWTWEGDTTILPRKWSAVIRAAFGDFGACAPLAVPRSK